MINKKNKYFKSVLCLGIGVITLTAAVFANYDNANGYNVCKNAAKRMLFETNFSADAKVEVKLDGQIMMDYSMVYKTAGRQDPNQYTCTEEAKRSTLSGDFKRNKWERTSTDDYGISIHTGEDGNIETFVHTNYYYMNGEKKNYNDGDDGSLIGSNDDMMQKTINFCELVCDALVGDIKNSIVLTDSDNGRKTYQISLSNNQVPDLFKAGAALIIGSAKTGLESEMEYQEQNPESYGGDLDSVIYYNALFGGEDPSLDSINGTAVIGRDGLPNEVDGTVVISGMGTDGKHHTMEIALSAKLYDFAMTSIEKIDINTLPGAVIFDGDDIKIIIDTNSSEEEQQKVKEKFDSYSAYRSKVSLVDQNGKVLEEKYDEDSGETAVSGETN